MKSLILALMLVMSSQGLFVVQIQAADPDTTEVQEANIKPLTGVGRVFRVDFTTKELGINDFVYTLTESTQYFKEDGSISRRDVFQPDTLVYYLADENGELLEIWLYNDSEHEYSQDNTTPENVPSGSAFDTKKNDTLINENGVWKN